MSETLEGRREGGQGEGGGEGGFSPFTSTGSKKSWAAICDVCMCVCVCVCICVCTLLLVRVYYIIGIGTAH